MSTSGSLADGHDAAAADFAQSLEKRPCQTLRASAGLDYVRVVGLILVIWQHVCSVLQRDELTRIGPLSLGQVGVGMFLAVSGYLAATSSRRPGEWILARIRRLFPAYWIVIVVCLFSAWWVGYKPVTWQLAVAQLMGIGGLTHGAYIVNTPTWFISLLLVCYLLAFLLKCLSKQGRIALLTALVVCAVGVVRGRGIMLVHISTFLFGFSLGASPWNPAVKKVAVGLLAIFTLTPLLGIYATLYPAVSMIVMWAGLRCRYVDPVSRRLADLSYYIYLVHGPILVALVMAMPGSWAALVGLGVPLSILAGFLLSMATRFLDRFAMQLMHWQPSTVAAS